MRVFTWKMEKEGARRTVVRPADGEAPSIECLPDQPSNIEWVLTAMINRLLDDELDSAVSIGLGGCVSPHVGIHRDDLVELFRMERDGRIYVTYAQGQWQQVHFIGRMPTLDVAKGVRARLVAHGQSLSEGRNCSVRVAGEEGLIGDEVVIFALVGSGPLFAQEPAA